MSQRFYQFLVFLLAAIATAQLVVIVTSLSPFLNGKDVVWGFFLSLFFSLLGWITLIWHAVKSRIHRSETISLLVSFRQALLFSAVTVVSVFFYTIQVLSIWDLIPLVFSALLLEFFFQANKTSHA